ncbi:MAG: hypothetical protein SAqTSB_36300 [Shewanella algae]
MGAEYTHQGLVKRLDPAYEKVGMGTYKVFLKRHGANWVTEGGRVFGSLSGNEPKRNPTCKLLLSSITELENEDNR